jgi:hypothetical protein
VDSVGQRRAHRDHWRLSAAECRSLGIVYQHDLDVGQRRKARELVVLEIAREHTAALEQHLLGQRTVTDFPFR